MLVLGGADESPKRGVSEIEDVFVGRGGDGALGEKDESSRGEALVADPGMEESERARGAAVGGFDDVGGRGGEGGKDDVRRGFASVESGQQTREIGETVLGAVDVSVAEDDDGGGVRSGWRLGELGPGEPEEGIAMDRGGAMDLVGRGLSGGEGADEGDGLTGGVGERDLDVAVASKDARAKASRPDGA